MMEGKCKCGMDYDCSKPKEYLEKLVANTPANRLPCQTCVSRIVNATADTLLRCFLCGKQRASKIGIRHHITSVHIQCTPYQCDHCDKRFKTREYWKTHLSIHSQDNKEKCKMCGELMRKDYINKHIQRFHSNNPPADFFCHICGVLIPASSYGGFRQHLQLHGDKTYKCPLCEKECRSEVRLSRHKWYFHSTQNATKQKPKTERLKCNYCSKDFGSKPGLQIHLKTKHSGTPVNRIRYPCENCDKIYKTIIGINDHKRIAHNIVSETSYKCKICGKSFLRYAACNRHEKIHTGEKKFKCDTCGVSFNQKCTLTRHQVVHTGEKPFECGICGQRFTQKPYMKVHEKMHDKVSDAKKNIK